VQHSDRIARGAGKTARHVVEVALWAGKADVTIRSLQDGDTFRDLLYAVVTGPSRQGPRTLWRRYLAARPCRVYVLLRSLVGRAAGCAGGAALLSRLPPTAQRPGIVCSERVGAFGARDEAHAAR
jgi:hypothetical protein